MTINRLIPKRTTAKGSRGYRATFWIITVGLVLHNGLGFHRLLQQAHGIRPLVEDDTTTEKKICVLFVGPHKTGSTTLEVFLEKEGRPALKEDHYVNYGRDIAHVVVPCLGKNRDKEKDDLCNEKLNELKSFISDNAGRSNIILAHEWLDFSNLNLNKLTSYLIPNYNIHVVVNYRRFYDWIYSYYNQIHKNPTHQHNKKIPTFQKWLTAHMEKEFRDKYSLSVYKRYSSLLEIYNVSVVNMHHDAANFDTVEAFACDQLDDAPHTCEAAKSRPKAIHKNPSKPLDWKIFRQRLKNYHSIGHVPDDDERWQDIEQKFDSMTDVPKACLSDDMKNKLLQISLQSETFMTPEWFHNSEEGLAFLKSMTDVPKACLSDDLKNKLLQISIQSETFMTPEWFHNSEEGLAFLKSDFEKKIKTTLCDIDVQAIVMSNEWQGFLGGLETLSRK
eukprot:CAMPEP_0203712246 /NCGR_PEP_ID=MMETSP0091-20130426/69940_1 /ASSEMBLY_ACC=CAM_ASM_001089 /TAXON_ID=426623 /ORGANISM="Chaetoceros affinis, Strain CCMP159" /LENGTH=445 /DNA_ID=CAMNT_0050590217 /DNA_START=38 /DNA_END=1376 /DNA_ORIENTATION=-